jgi:hypothetical protein
MITKLNQDVVVLQISDNEETQSRKSIQIHDAYASIFGFTNLIKKIIGIYHSKTDCRLIKFYRIVMLTILWLNFFKSFITYDFNGSNFVLSNFVLRALLSIWSFICAFNATILFIMDEFDVISKFNLINYTNFLFHSYASFYKNTKSLRFLKLRVNLIFFMMLTFGFINSLATVVSFFGPKYFYPAFVYCLAPFHETTWVYDQIWLKLFFTLIIIQSSFYWTLSIADYASNCFVIIHMFSVFNKSFKIFIQSGVIVDKHENEIYRDTTIENLNENVYVDFKVKVNVGEEQFDFFHLWHSKLCIIVDELNKCYTHFVGVSLIFYVLQVLLLLYVLSNWKESCIFGVLKIVYPFWTIVSIYIMLLLIVPASIINSQVIFFLLK